MPMPLLNLFGRRFGRLTIATQARRGALPSGRRFIRWNAICDCGRETIVATTHLRRGTVKSCGCLRREAEIAPAIKHSHAQRGKKSSEYRSWIAMKNRCHNPKADRFDDYGGRGIRVCRRWLNSFPTFLADMGPKPTPTHTVERIDNDGNYTPRNCRWATQREQRRNQRPRRTA